MPQSRILSHAESSTVTVTIAPPNPAPEMADSDAGIWKLRWDTAVAEGAGYLLVAIVCLASELLIWGLSRTLAAARLEFFSTIVGMALVFALSTACWVVWKRTDGFYRRWLKARVRDAQLVMALLGLCCLLGVAVDVCSC